MDIKVFTQSAIKLSGTKTIYIDPYKIETKYADADYIFITHDHYDHYDESSIKNIINSTTCVIVPTCLYKKIALLTENIIIVEPNQHYSTKDLSFETIPSYNTKESYHPKEKNYVGYNILLDGLYYYIMGDTNRTKETDQVKTDICFVPIGGTYTMDIKEATDYINFLKPKKVIPTHYGSIVGDITLGEELKNKINKEIKVEILIK